MSVLVKAIAAPQKPPKKSVPEMPHPLTTEFTDVCGDRRSCTWRKFHGATPSAESFRYGMMFDVEFATVSGPGGCVGVYTGHALGGLVENLEPPPNILAKARKPLFDRDEGLFRDSLTGKILRRVSMLILKDGLHLAYVP